MYEPLGKTELRNLGGCLVAVNFAVAGGELVPADKLWLRKHAGDFFDEVTACSNAGGL